MKHKRKDTGVHIDRLQNIENNYYTVVQLILK